LKVDIFTSLKYVLVLTSLLKRKKKKIDFSVETLCSVSMFRQDRRFFFPKSNYHLLEQTYTSCI